jgi:hypothetical protein
MLKTTINNIFVEFYPAVLTDDKNGYLANQETYTVQSNQECISNICNISNIYCEFFVFLFDLVELDHLF